MSDASNAASWSGHLVTSGGNGVDGSLPNTREGTHAVTVCKLIPPSPYGCLQFPLSRRNLAHDLVKIRPRLWCFAVADGSNR